MSKSLLEELKKSILQALLGLLAIPAAFYLVYRASEIPEHKRKLADARPASEASETDSSDLAYATGRLKASPLSDAPFLSAGPYLRLKRHGEILAWVQSKENTAPAGQPPAYRYSCQEEWTTSPDEDIEKRAGCQDRRNYGRKFFLDQERSVEELHIEANGKQYAVGLDFTARGFSAPAISRKELRQPFKAKDGYFYIDTNCLENLETECERMHWSGLAYNPDQNYTIAGRLEQGKFIPEVFADGTYLLLAPGDFSDLLLQFAPYVRWIMAGYFSGSLLLFWLGLSGMNRPILKLMEFIPVIGSASAAIVRAIFMLASLLTVGLCYFLLPYWYIVPALLFLAFAFLIGKRIRNSKSELTQED